MRVKVIEGGLEIDGKRVPLVSGTMHYWRVSREKWEPILDLVQELGFSMVETYMPWSVHEVSRGRFDFGETAEKALEEFIKLVHSRGMYLLARPGPHINAELTGFGYPERVLRDRRCLSVSVDGDPVWIPAPPKMWPAPSYAAEAFYEEVGIFFDALAPLLRRHLYPDGPIIALQVDNEFSNFFRNSAWDHDYHPDALKLWRKFLAEKYGEEKAGLAAPREFKARTKDDLPFYLDWIAFKEYYMQTALQRFKKMWEKRGVSGVPIFHNYPTGHDVPPNNYTELEKFLDFQGPDMYPGRKQYWSQKSLCCFASGLSRLPCIPEFSSGSFFWSVPLGVEDQRFTTPVCFMHGIKAINFYMIVERERWYGSPITRDGRKRRAYFEMYQDFHRWLKKTRINELTKQAAALLLSVRDYQRLALAVTLMDPLPPLSPDLVPAEVHCSEETFGFVESIPIRHETQWSALFHGLSAAHVPFDCGNTSQPLEALCKYPMVLCPSCEFLERGVQEKLVAYARQGGTLVIGPRLPELDEQMKPCLLIQETFQPEQELDGGRAKLANCGRGKIILLGPLPPSSGRRRPEDTSRLLAAIAEAVDLPRPFSADDPLIETVLHADEKSAVLFVANPTAEDRTARLQTDGRGLVDVRTEEEFAGGAVEISLPAYTVRIFEVRTP